MQGCAIRLFLSAPCLIPRRRPVGHVPFSFYDGRKWCPRSAAEKKKAVPAIARYRKSSRAYFPTLALSKSGSGSGRNSPLSAGCQPAPLFLFSFSILKPSTSCVKNSRGLLRARRGQGGRIQGTVRRQGTVLCLRTSAEFFNLSFPDENVPESGQSESH